MMDMEKEKTLKGGMETTDDNCTMPGDPLDEEQQTKFRRLYERSYLFYRAVAVDNLYEALPNDYGTGEPSNMTEAHMMIDVCDNAGITVGELARLSARTPSAVSQIISRLEKKGYLYKQRCRTNYRSYHIYPTEKGRRLALAHKRYDIEHMSALNEYLLTECTPQEIDAFYKVLSLRTAHTLSAMEKIKGKK